MKGSLVVELHAWRGVGRRRDLFMTFYTAGFVTAGTSRALVDEALRELKAQLERLLGRGNGA